MNAVSDFEVASNAFRELDEAKQSYVKDHVPTYPES